MKFKATFFGGSFNDKETLEYKETILIGEFLSNKGYVIKNGGYYGLMEAISYGSHSVGGEQIGYTCKTFPSIKGNKYLSETIVCDDIYDRLKGLISDTDVFIVQRGGIGTLSELFLCLDIIRKKKEKPSIFLIGSFWTNIFKELEYLIPEKDLFIICDNYSEFIKKF